MSANTATFRAASTDDDVDDYELPHNPDEGGLRDQTAEMEASYPDFQVSGINVPYESNSDGIWRPTAVMLGITFSDNAY